MKMNYILETDLAFAIPDKFPKTKGHMLVVIKRSISRSGDATNEELEAVNKLLYHLQKWQRLNDPEIKSFDIGRSIDAAAGRMMPHCSWHLIPRRDTTD